MNPACRVAQPVFHGESGTPWHLTCTVIRVGTDYVCHVHGGDWHVGAVALSQWRDDRIETACLIVGRHKERDIATHAADSLCSATGRTTVCIAGIHFEGVESTDIQDISRAARKLATQAGRQLHPLVLRDSPGYGR